MMIVDVLDEYMSGPFLLAVQCCKAELVDWMAVGFTYLKSTIRALKATLILWVF